MKIQNDRQTTAKYSLVGEELKQANLWQKEYWNWIGNPSFLLWQLFKLFSEYTLVMDYVLKLIFESSDVR